MLAVTSVAKDYSAAKATILKVNLFTPLLVYLARAIDMLSSSQGSQQYTEDRVMAVLNLLS